MTSNRPNRPTPTPPTLAPAALPATETADPHALATPQPDIYVLAAHPHWRASRINRQLRDVAQAHARAVVCDVYGRYADYHIDVAAEQARLSAARLVVLLHPIHWYAMPALMKLWMDEVLTYGWAYGGGTALAGKDFWLVATTGGSEDSYHPQGYNRYFFDAFLPPYEQAAALCGMRFLPPMIFHGAHRADDAAVAAHVTTFQERLHNYPNWPELDDLSACAGCAMPRNERPSSSTAPGAA